MLDQLSALQIKLIKLYELQQILTDPEQIINVLNRIQSIEYRIVQLGGNY